MHKMKKVIVSGANGFIGTALVNELLANNIYVIALVYGNENNFIKHDKLQTIQYSFESQNDLINNFGDDIDIFYHLAWQGSSGAERSNALLQYANIKWTIDCLYMAKKLGAKRFVGAGSLMEKEAIYDVPKRENKPSAVSVYGTAKLSSHYITKIIAAEIGIDHIWCYLTAYGVGDSPYRFIGATINKMISGEKIIPFTKADQFYDFVYITDTAKALYLTGLRGIPFCPYYIGSGNPNRLRFFIEEMKNVLNIDSVLDFGAVDYKGIYMPKKEFDSSQLQIDTGFKCEIPFKEGIIKTANWLKGRKNV